MRTGGSATGQLGRWAGGEPRNGREDEDGCREARTELIRPGGLGRSRNSKRRLLKEALRQQGQRGLAQRERPSLQHKVHPVCRAGPGVGAQGEERCSISTRGWCEGGRDWKRSGGERGSPKAIQHYTISPNNPLHVPNLDGANRGRSREARELISSLFSRPSVQPGHAVCLLHKPPQRSSKAQGV
ncbi:hypothetical protein KOW79_008783 [Hemibagrus wyckioides]|uniref:Uncharacterized protein n=1 Tax=Hemibagrus wyckioides TaxID=337641 RepID=A0A9D3NRW1_9TELE|nr:hypothetical protein KOW79_008783 [Hemibagrus wyckioides]